jgi:hypothetical protein
MEQPETSWGGPRFRDRSEPAHEHYPRSAAGSKNVQRAPGDIAVTRERAFSPNSNPEVAGGVLRRPDLSATVVP